MKTIDELREGFEEIFAINMMLYQLYGKVVFCDNRKAYIKQLTNQGDLTGGELEGLSWLNGAWFMYQELNK